MSTLATMLKQEIHRLARKEINTYSKATNKALALRRRDIAELKRQNTTLHKRLSFLEHQERGRVKQKPSKELGDSIRFSGAYVKGHRKKLGFTAAEYGRLVGVTALTIYNWERGTRPRQQLMANWATIRNLKKREAQKRLNLLD